MDVKYIKIALNGSNKNSDIYDDRDYVVRFNGELFSGTFKLKWFGWTFRKSENEFMQLNMLDEVNEVIYEDCDEKTRQISISRFMHKVLKYPMILDLKKDDEGRFILEDLIQKWNDSDDPKYKITLRDVVIFFEKSHKLNYNLNTSNCYLERKNEEEVRSL